MEKRLFLAIGLSIMVVWLWSATAPTPESQQEDLELSQTVGTNKDTIIQDSFKAPSPLPEASLHKVEKNEKIIERLEILNSEKLQAEFSNIGGSLNKVTLKEYNTTLPIKNIAGLSGYENLPFVLDQISENEIKYSYEDSDYKIIKSYNIHDGDYIIESGIEFYNKSNMSKLINVQINGYSIEMSNLKKKEGFLSGASRRDAHFNEYVIKSGEKHHRKGNASDFKEKERDTKLGEVDWIGFRNRYFCALVKPEYTTKSYIIDPVSKTNLNIRLDIGEVMLLANSSKNFNSILFFGPEKENILKKYGKGFESIKLFYRFQLFNFFSKAMYHILYFVQKFIPNWGVCIIFMAFFVYGITYPLTMKSMLAMKKMQAHQPELNKIKEKYKDNQQKASKETMEYMRKYKVNPMSGCFPMILQMPIFIGFIQVLWRDVSFKGAKFLWIKDLSEPDKLFILPFNLPFFGNEFNLLPVLYAGLMFTQQKFQSKNMVVTDPAQIQTQKMMTTIMPLVLGVLFYKFASGLNLYFTLYFLLSTFTQWKMSKVKVGV